MNAEAWLAEIGKAADELGFGVEVIELGRIRLVPIYRSDATVELSSVLLSGDLLRALLRKQEKPERKP